MIFDKFLRYTIPGLVSLLVFYFLTSFTSWENARIITESEISLGYIAGLVFVTGGMGAIFNILYWALCHFIYYPLNHTKLLSSLKGKLKILDPYGNVVNKISKREAWSIFNTYWYSKTNLRIKFEAINPRVDRLSDVTHGIGTTLVGLIVTLIICVIWNLRIHSTILPSLIIGMTFIFLTFFNYIHLLKMYQTVLNTTFATILNEDLNQIIKEDPSKTYIEITLVK
jgi:hypothetical protein